MAREDLVIRIAGEAGEGVLITGQMVTQATARAGYHVLTDSVPPAEIKGGYSFYQIRLGERRLQSRGDAVDVLLAFNQEAFDNSVGQLRKGGVLIYDSAELNPPTSDAYVSYGVPLTEIAKNQVELALAKNMVAVGVVASLFGLDLEHAHRLLRESKLAKKGEDILNKNLKAIDLGHAWVQEHVKERASLEVQPAGQLAGRIVLSGNQAVALGALVAGCRRYAGYPITPATDIMEFLAEELPKVGGAVVQAEDEIAAIGMVLGSSYAGQKSMTATSGPGLSLMTEMLGLASMAEIPAVIVDCQRAGPSTGMPTRHEQGDLNHAVYASHGEASRVVVAPTSVTDCFWTTIHAFNLAEEFQLPVIVLQDTVLAVRTEAIPRPDLSAVQLATRRTFAYRDVESPNGHGYDSTSGPERYLRYQFTDDGVSNMAIPGTAGGAYVATGLEHTQAANTSSEARNHSAMTEKRFKKLEGVLGKAPPAHEYGDPSAEIGFLTWGSTFGAVCEAIDRLAADGIKAHALAPRLLWPLPTHQIDPFLNGKRVVYVPEVNYTGQFAQLLRAEYQKVEFTSINVYGGQPFSVSRIVEAVLPKLAPRTGGTPVHA